MSILSAIQSACVRVQGTKPEEIFSGTAQIALEMADLANEVAADIAASHDWRGLTRIHRIAGASTVPLPEDYSRMVLASEMDDPATWFWGYEAVSSVNEFMRLQSGDMASTGPGYWIILEGAMHFYPGAQGEAQFPYISTHFARTDEGDRVSEFTQDNDVFVLGNRLLTLGLIWRWKSQKGMEYGEDMATYETALAQAQARDKGAYVVRQSVRSRFGGSTAYSGRAIR